MPKHLLYWHDQIQAQDGIVETVHSQFKVQRLFHNLETLGNEPIFATLRKVQARTLSFFLCLNYKLKGKLEMLPLYVGEDVMSGIYGKKTHSLNLLVKMTA